MARGVSLENFIESSIAAYRKGFNDAIQFLIEQEKAIDNNILRESIERELAKIDVTTKKEW